MLGEQQTIIPNFTSNPNPNPNPSQSHSVVTDSYGSSYPHSSGFDGLPASEPDRAGDSATYEHGDGTLSETNSVPTVMQPAGNSGVWTQHVVNNVIISSWQSEQISQSEQVSQSEQISQSEPISQSEQISQPMQCEVCNITCNSEDVLEKHKNGKKHLKNVQKLALSALLAPQMPPLVPSAPVVGVIETKKHRLLQNGASVDTLLYCEICDVVCNSQDVLRKHLAGKKHSAKAAARHIVNEFSNPTSEFIPEAQPSNGGSQMKPDTLHLPWCELCNISCTSVEGLNVHLMGKKHARKLLESEQQPDPSLTPIESLGRQPDSSLTPTESLGRQPDSSLTPTESLGTQPDSSLTPTESLGTQPIKPMENTESTEGKTVILQEVKSVRCELCGIDCNTYDVLQNHISGKKHQKKLLESEKKPDSSLTSIESLDTQPIKPMENPESTEGKTVISQEGKPAWCELCEIDCNSYDALQNHISGKKHQKKLEISKRPIGPNPAPATLKDSLKEEGKVVNSDGGSNRKAKRAGNDDENLETKKQKVLESGAASDALRTCTVCNVICNSPTVFISHLAGQKHAAMAVKQAEARSNGQET